MKEIRITSFSLKVIKVVHGGSSIFGGVIHER
jgi:hypothetical protein